MDRSTMPSNATGAGTATSQDNGLTPDAKKGLTIHNPSIIQILHTSTAGMQAFASDNDGIPFEPVTSSTPSSIPSVHIWASISNHSVDAGSYLSATEPEFVAPASDVTYARSPINETFFPLSLDRHAQQQTAPWTSASSLSVNTGSHTSGPVAYNNIYERRNTGPLTANLYAGHNARLIPGSSEEASHCQPQSQLQTWVYENSRPNQTLAEHLEQGNWEGDNNSPTVAVARADSGAVHDSKGEGEWYATSVL